MSDYDDGNVYGGEGAQTPDYRGGTRVPMPIDPRDMRPGVPLKNVPRGTSQLQGSQARANVNIDRPVALTPIDFDPRISAPIGVTPTRFDHDPRLDLGSSTELRPAYVVMGRLQSIGVEPWMIQWVYDRGRRGLPTDDAILRQCVLLAHFGDGLAGKMVNYIHQVNNSIATARENARRSQAARIGVRYRR